MSDRIAVMNLGRVEQVANPEEVYERPETTFVAGFIGVSNLMPATVEAGGVHLDNGPTVPAAQNGFRPGERCQAVVRPEKLHINRIDEASDGSLPSVEGTVESSVYLGTSTQIVVEIGGDVRMTVLHPNASEAERQRLPGGGLAGEAELASGPHAPGARVRGRVASGRAGRRRHRLDKATRRGNSDDKPKIADPGRGGPDAGGSGADRRLRRRRRQRRRRGPGRPGRQAVRRGDDLQLAGLHRPWQGRHRRRIREDLRRRHHLHRGRHREHPVLRQAAAAARNAATPAAAASSSSPTGWRSRCTTSATSSSSTTPT